jgi:hypothetical protein
MRSPYTVAPDGLRLAREYLELPFPDSAPGSTRDPSVPVVFVSIDFENTSQFVDSGPSIPIQLGVATLDTQDFPTLDPKDIISTFNLPPDHHNHDISTQPQQSSYLERQPRFPTRI